MQQKVHKESDIGKIVVRNEGRRPVYLASMDTTDTHVMALADLIFWTDQLREHAKFMEMLLPIEDLASWHERAVMYRGIFEAMHSEAKNTELNKDDISALSNSVVMRTEPLIRFKRELREEQASGKIHSLIFPLFLDHIAREAERFARRQKMFMEGKTEFGREEIINFWSQIMAEHANFIAHLLDPEERDLFTQALHASENFEKIQKEHALEGRTDPVTMDVDHLIDFKTAALKGIETGKIKSIITPELADHVRREAIVFSNELRRADMMMNIEPKAA